MLVQVQAQGQLQLQLQQEVLQVRQQHHLPLQELLQVHLQLPQRAKDRWLAQEQLLITELELMLGVLLKLPCLELLGQQVLVRVWEEVLVQLASLLTCPLLYLASLLHFRGLARPSAKYSTAFRNPKWLASFWKGITFLRRHLLGAENHPNE